MKILGYFICYLIISSIGFAAAIIVIPGFPFFPSDVYSSTNEVGTVRLNKGAYTILYYIKGQQSLSVSRGDIGSIDIFNMTVSGTNNLIPSTPQNYYFDNAPNRFGIRGHAICSFYIPTGETITVHTHFRDFDYQGFIIRTSLNKFFAAIILFEVTVLVVSFLAFKIVFKKNSRANN